MMYQFEVLLHPPYALVKVGNGPRPMQGMMGQHKILYYMYVYILWAKLWPQATVHILSGCAWVTRPMAQPIRDSNGRRLEAQFKYRFN